MGYEVRKVEGEDDVFGGYQAILFQKMRGSQGNGVVNGVYHGASDFRKGRSSRRLVIGRVGVGAVPPQLLLPGPHSPPLLMLA